MSLQPDVKLLIARAIAHTAFSISCSIPEGGLIRIIEEIERELDEAGLVIVPAVELGSAPPDGPHPEQG